MKISLLLSVLLSFFGTVSAQIPAEPRSVQSPNAASLGLYGEVPVSLYTGLPSIEVPLYTVQEGRIEVPIALSYHASGFRPDMHPGWVGMGWNLAAGGAISRTIHDLPDEYSNSNSFRLPNGPTAGYYFTSGGLNQTGWSDTTYMKRVAQTNLATDYDTEPDEFAFNFGEYSGKFYLDAQKNWRVKCDKPLKVTPFVPGQASAFLDVPFPIKGLYQTQYGRSQTFVGFTMTTEDGTQYVFGGATSAIEYEIGMFHQDLDEWRANAWQLTQIIHNDGHHIEFTYARDTNEFVAQMSNSMNSNISTRAVTPNSPPPLLPYLFPVNIALFSFLNFGSDECSTTSINEIYDWQYAGQLLAPVYLTSIVTSNSTVFFDRAPTTEKPYDRKVFEHQYGINPAGFVFFESFPPYYPESLTAKLIWKKLTTIRVVSKVQPVKSFLFSYNDNDNERLTLLQVFEQGSTGQRGIAKPPYRFGYNKYHSLPGYLVNKSDHWGFYNAREAIADYTNNFSAYYGYREASTDSAVYLAGMLTRIVYPTGGITDFEYEQHSFGKQLSENRFLAPEATTGAQPAGGVRIKKITSYSPENSGQKLTKEYLYVIGYTPTNTTGLTSSGILGGRARYVFLDYRAKAFNQANANYSRSVFSSQSVLPACSNSRGSHIGYSTVVEKRSDGSYTQYTYSNFDSGNLDESPANVLQAKSHSRTLYSPYTSKDEERGKLLREDLFTNTGLPVKQKKIDYVALNKDSEYVPALAAFAFPVCTEHGDPAGIPPNFQPALTDEATAYKFYTYSYLPVRQTETVFDRNGANGLTTVTTTDYNADKLPTRVATTSSKGETLVTTYRYPWDPKYNYTVNLTDPVARTLSNMRGAHILKYPLETVVSKNGNVVAATVQTFNQGGTFGSGTQFFQTFQLEPTTAVPAATYNGLQVNTGIQANGKDNPPVITPPLKLTFAGYDPLGNVLSIQKEGDQRSSYLWGYGGTLLTAQVTNASRTLPVPSNPSIGNEASYLGFESGTASPGTNPDEDYWNMAATANSSIVATAHTGNFSWRIGPTSAYNYGPGHTFIPERQQLRYTLSAWVKTEPGYVANSGHLVMSVNRQDGTYAGATGCYQAADVVDTNGKWQYIEVVLDLNAAHNNLGIPVTTTSERLQINAYPYSYNAGAAGFLVDDLRFQPTDAQMTTYTHLPLVGVTSVSDVNNRPIFYEYDALNRLLLIRDQDGNAVKQYRYNYKNQ